MLLEQSTMATLWRFPQKNHVKREAEENGQKEMAITAAGQKLLVGPRPLLPEDQPSNMSLRLSVHRLGAAPSLSATKKRKSWTSGMCVMRRYGWTYRSPWRPSR